MTPSPPKRGPSCRPFPSETSPVEDRTAITAIATAITATVASPISMPSRNVIVFYRDSKIVISGMTDHAELFYEYDLARVQC